MLGALLLGHRWVLGALQCSGINAGCWGHHWVLVALLEVLLGAGGIAMLRDYCRVLGGIAGCRGIAEDLAGCWDPLAAIPAGAGHCRGG